MRERHILPLLGKVFENSKSNLQIFVRLEQIKLITFKTFNTMDDSRKVLGAVLVGAAAGLVAGLLIAPEKGSVTRRRIADGTRKMSDRVVDLTNKGVSAFSTLKEKILKNGELTESPAEEGVW